MPESQEKSGASNHLSRPIPAPAVSVETKPFWDATAEGKLLLPRCTACGVVIWYPRAFCPECNSFDVEWFEASGRGTIYSRTIIRQNPTRTFKHLIPFVVALIDLDEGPRVMSNVVGTPADDVQIGDRVRVTFQPVSDDAALPLFELDR